MPREKSRYRDRRSSSYNSDSSHEKKRLKSKHRRRSRSRDGSEFTARRRKRSSSRSKHKRRSYSRSVSRDRYDSKSRRRSSSRSRSGRIRRSVSRGRSHSRSSSKSRSKYTKGTRRTKRRSRSTSSRSGSFDIEPANPIKRVNHDDTDTKIEKAIKAAEAAGLTLTKIPTYEVKEVKIKEDMPTIHDRNLLAELNSESFVQKSFTSSKNKKQSQNIVIDLNSDTVKVPDTKIKVDKEDSIIDFDELPNEEDLKEMWIKKLYQYRKKLLRGEI